MSLWMTDWHQHRVYYDDGQGSSVVALVGEPDENGKCQWEARLLSEHCHVESICGLSRSSAAAKVAALRGAKKVYDLFVEKAYG